MSLAVYPGSFDPITNGHLNLIERGLRVFDRLLVAVATNVQKAPLFSAEDRMQMIRDAVEPNENLDVDSFEGLLVEYAERNKATSIVRGLRAISDFEYEFQMAHMNRRLSPGLETVFMMTGEEHFYVSSQLVREVAGFGGDVCGLVPPHVERMLKERFQK